MNSVVAVVVAGDDAEMASDYGVVSTYDALHVALCCVASDTTRSYSLTFAGIRSYSLVVGNDYH